MNDILNHVIHYVLYLISLLKYLKLIIESSYIEAQTV